MLPPEPARRGLALPRACFVAALVLSVPLLSRWLSIASSDEFIIYYPPMLARAGSLFRMCAVAQANCKHVSEFPKLMRVVTGTHGQGGHNVPAVGQGDTFALPVLEHRGRRLSQSVAETLYLGEHVGFGVGPDMMDISKAVQYMSDLNDMNSELMSRRFEGKTNGNWSRMKEWNDGGRLDSWLTNIERSIQGPYYSGDHLTSPDFYFAMMMSYQYVMNPKASTHDLLTGYPKAHALRIAMDGLPTWEHSQYSKLMVLPPSAHNTKQQLQSYAQAR